MTITDREIPISLEWTRYTTQVLGVGSKIFAIHPPWNHPANSCLSWNKQTCIFSLTSSNVDATPQRQDSMHNNSWLYTLVTHYQAWLHISIDDTHTHTSITNLHIQCNLIVILFMLCIEKSNLARFLFIQYVFDSDIKIKKKSLGRLLDGASINGIYRGLRDFTEF